MAPMRRLHRRGNVGAAALEFAMLVPILLLVVFGLIQYGFYFWAYQGGSDVARSATRLAAVGEPAACSDFRTKVRDEISALAGSGATATITRKYFSPANVQRASGAEVQVGDTVTVMVSFTSTDLDIPLVPFVEDGRVESTTSARVEYLPAQPEVCS